MIKWHAYLQLLRLHKPAGTLLLWCPTAWALWLANKGMIPLQLLILLTLGTLLMRSAGCVFNDIADRKFDKQVARTKMRPITSGLVSVQEAFVILAFLLSLALILVLYLPQSCFLLALFSLFIVLIYPFGKRFLKAPQMVLGLAFSLGIPMAYLASDVPLDKGAGLIFAINFLWIVAYDTMYAMTDKEDDLKIGINSTAIYFGNSDKLIIALLLFSLHNLWLVLLPLYSIEPSLNNMGLWSLGLIILLYQLKLINKRVPQDCFKAFNVSIYYGLCMWFFIYLLNH